jgi:DNA-binding PadR family transcriptional regulator
VGKGIALSFDRAVLTLVSEQPGHAFEVGSRFLLRYGTRFGQRRASVYEALDRLERDGLVESCESIGVRGRKRELVHYHVTHAGRDDAHGWLRSPVSKLAPKRDDTARTRGRRADEVLARIGATSPDDVETMSALLDIYEQLVTAELKEPAPAQRGLFAGWTQEWRRTQGAARLEWIWWARADLRKRAKRS